MESDEEGGKVFTVTRRSQRNRKGHKFSCLKCCVIGGSAVCLLGCLIITLALSTVLSITQLVIGILYKDQCPINDNIPLYLIVAGAVGLVAFVIQCCQELTKKGIGRILFILVGLFQLAWVITGSVWTFQVYSIVQYHDPTQTYTYCHPTAYECAFVTIIMALVFIVCSLCTPTRSSNDDDD